MATSKSFFGIRKGSTKNFTFTQLNGKQVTKERVEQVKNPRTQAQMVQRMLMTTAGSAYKYLKEIVDHSFEGKTVGQQCMAEFMRLNLNKLRAAYVAGETHAYNAYKDAAINPYAYIIASGSLSGVPFAFSGNNLEVSANADTVATAEDVYKALGVGKGDLITFVGVKGISQIVDGVYNYIPNSFKIVRLYCNKTGSITNPTQAFTIEANQAGLSVNISHIGSVLSIALANVDFAGVIRSAQVAGSWKRSNATMRGNANIISGVNVANQLATYPIEKELVLNNGEMNFQSSGASLIPLSLSVSPASVSITSDKGTASVPTLKGNLGSGAVTYSGYNTGVISISGGVITAVDNGTTTVTVNVASDGTYAAAYVKFNVTVSGQTSPGGGGGGSNIE